MWLAVLLSSFLSFYKCVSVGAAFVFFLCAHTGSRPLLKRKEERTWRLSCRTLLEEANVRLLSLSSLTLQTYTFSSHSLSLLGNRRREREKENDCEGECVCKERRCELTSLDCPLTGHKRKALKANRLTVNSQDLWLAKDNRFLNPKISYERILMAPPCRLISLFLIL